MKKSKSIDILYFIAATYILTWILWAAAFRVNGVFRMIGSFVPSAMGIFFIWKENGRSGLQKMYDRIRRCRIKWYVYLFAAVYTIGSFGLPYILAGLFQKMNAFQIRSSISGIPVNSPWMAAACFILILLIGGPLGEELGWRGYLLPKLEEKFSAAVSGILVGIVWAFWHLPMFLIHAEGYQLPFWLYLVQTILLSMICTWIYTRSGSSLLLVILFHTMDDFVCSIAFQDMLNGKNLYTVLYWLLQIVIVSLISLDLRRRKHCYT